MQNDIKHTPKFNTAYFVFRTWARFIGSVFFSFFRAWGETDLKPGGGRIVVVKYLGLITWLTVLRTFRNPVKFLVSGVNDDRWLELATGGGLEPQTLKQVLNEDIKLIADLSLRENIVLMIPETPDDYSIGLLSELKKMFPLKVLFFAVSGAHNSLPEGSYVPKAFPISAFCGLPLINSREEANPLAELQFLEKAIQNVPLNELPSIFLNHPNNQSLPDK